MRFLAMLREGYLPGEDFNDVHPQLLYRYYGVDGEVFMRRQGQTGAGHYDHDAYDGDIINDEDSSSSDDSSSSSSSESDSEDIRARLAEDQQRHVRHPPIPVPSSDSPFQDAETEQTFLRCLQEVQDQKIIPDGYGLKPEEWEESTYGEEEFIPYGRSGRGRSVILPFQIWWPRAVAWAQGLELMNRLLL